MSQTPLTLAETASVFGEMLTFLFTPQSDTDFMLTVAGIMASFKAV